jgi:hypothetical protein
VAIRRRRRRDRGRRAEARRPGALRPPRGANVFTNPPRSDQPRSIRVGEPMDCWA